jgi:putative flippase GtrA
VRPLRPHARKLARYSAVSVATAVFGQVVLIALYAGLGWAARPANVVAFVTAAVPSYWLNRTWTWGRTGRSHLLREVVPFWVVSAVGLALTTWTAGLGESWAEGLTSSRPAQALVVSATVVGTFAVVWVSKYVLFDRVLFAEPARR